MNSLRGGQEMAKKHTKKAPPANIVEKARQLLGQEQRDIQLAVDAMKLTRHSRKPYRYRVERLIYRGA
jgi:hypothetical protein